MSHCRNVLTSDLNCKGPHLLQTQGFTTRYITVWNFSSGWDCSQHSFTASYLSRNNKELHPRDPVSFEKPSGSPSSAWTRGGNDSENGWMRSLIIKLFDSGGEAGGKEGKLRVWWNFQILRDSWLIFKDKWLTENEHFCTLSEFITACVISLRW